MKQLLLFILTLLITTACQKEQKQTYTATYDKNTTTLINIYGKTDKRLELNFYVSYRPKYFRDGKVTDECAEVLLHPATATKRGKLLHVSGATVKNQDEYNLTFPIFNKILHDKCTSTPIGISVRITRANEKHGLFAQAPILTDTPQFIGEATSASYGAGWDGKGAYREEALRTHGKVKEPPKYFRVKDGARVECYTKHYEKDGKFRESVDFRCELPYKDNATWQDEIVDDKIHLDIIIDENKSYYYPPLSQIRKSVKGHSEPFQEEELNIFNKLKLWIKGE